MKIKKILRILASVLLCSILLIGQASADLPSQVSVGMAMPKSQLEADDALSLQLTYTNSGSESVRFLKWGTGLEGGITENFLNIEIDGVRIPYSGIHAKRTAPQPQHFVTLLAGASQTVTVDISQGYKLTQKGVYEIFYERSHGEAPSAKSQPLTIELTEERPIILAKQPAIFENCSASQQSQINQALGQAARIAGTARNDLNNAPQSLRPNARRYREWFGQFDAGRYQTVTNRMTSIASALSNQRIGFDCDCTGQQGIDPNFTFAFVFPSDAFNMTLCGAFWRARLLGTDSRSGTIVHEVSHFNIVANTDDFRPNQQGIRQLASSQPNSAIRAANAYEYFAENTPFLSMPSAADAPPDESEPDPETEPQPEPEPEPSVPAFIVPMLDLLLLMGRS